MGPIESKLGSRTKDTVWMEFAKILRTIEDPVNLGQGYPDWDPPEFVKMSASEAIALGFNQYTRTEGHPALVEVLAHRYSKHLNRTINPMDEIAVTVGCSQALYLALTALVSPGDEVILLEPFFDLYYNQIKLAGGIPKSVALDLTEDRKWKVNLERLESAVTDKTKAIILNTPHNPTGKVFSQEELEGIADIVRQNPRLSVISDEVYKYIINDPSSDNNILANGEACEVPPVAPPKHVHFASLPGMWDRTVTCSSAGKTFSITGWQVGWLLGPKDFVSRVHTLLPYVQFCAPSPMQHALAKVLQDADQPYEGFCNYYAWLRYMYDSKRSKLMQGLSVSGLKPTDSQGGFFIMADASRLLPMVPKSYLESAKESGRSSDFALCRWLAEEQKLITIPGSPFFSSSREDGKSLAPSQSEEKKEPCLIRLAFCKKDIVLDRACDKLAEIGRQLEEFEKSSGKVNQDVTEAPVSAVLTK
eukprot:CAMPEP_0167740562 /NCGR_PEP_ID=MMETSP0110_2-20121227/352_1 /TAXON_ID=629695 /ORGANISM="Gymnochlora sp., Strain CCMP2014" /LENGTH=474 /DNA_ID=CAMNT_0007624481 /DNA_START=228 /DNA_END=1652 /DNA_ORIENTATION=-